VGIEAHACAHNHHCIALHCSAGPQSDEKSLFNITLFGNMQFRLSNSQRYLVVGLVGLPLTVTIRVSRVSAMVSVRVSIN